MDAKAGTPKPRCLRVRDSSEFKHLTNSFFHCIQIGCGKHVHLLSQALFRYGSYPVDNCDDRLSRTRDRHKKWRTGLG